jgi:hypothetical protein
VNGISETDGSHDPDFNPVNSIWRNSRMADIRHDAVLSAAWILTRRAQQWDPPTSRGEAYSQVPKSGQGSQTSTKEMVSKLIAAYLDTPTQLSSNLCSW